MMGPIEIEKQNYKYRVFEYGGNYYVEGTCLDLLGINRSSPPSFLEWTRDKYFPITLEQIEKLKDYNGPYNYYPDFFTMDFQQSDSIRSIDDAQFIKGLSSKKQEYINETFKKIIYMDNKDFNEKYNKLIEATVKYEYSEKPFEKEIGLTLREAIHQKINSPSFMEYLGDAANLGHPEWISEQRAK